MFNPLPLTLRHARRTKLRLVLGVLGMAIAVGILTALNVGIDTVSRTYLDALTITAGQADAIVVAGSRRRHVPWFAGDPLVAKLERLPEVAHAAARLTWPVRVRREQASAGATGTGGGAPANPRQVGGLLLGIDLAREQAAGETSFGAFVDASKAARQMADEGTAPKKLTDLRLGDDACALSRSLAQRLELDAPGATIVVSLQSRQRSFRVAAIVESRGVLPGGDGVEFVLVGRGVATEILRGELAVAVTQFVGTFVPADGETPERFVAAKPPRGYVRGRAIAALRALYQTFGDTLGYDPEALAQAGTSLWDFHKENAEPLARLWRERAGALEFASDIVVSFADRQRLYDAQDISATVLRTRDVASRVQRALGFNYAVQLPKAVALQAMEQMTSLFRGFFLLFSVLALAISGLLIYSLVSVSVEERVRESGILRTLGAKRRHVLGLVLIETLVMAGIGLAVGVAGGAGLCAAAAALVDRLFAGQGWDFQVSLVYTPQAFVSAIVAGLVVGLFAGLAPAVRATRVSIVDALRPARLATTSTGTTTERTFNTRLVVIGFVLSTFMISMYYALSLIFIHADLSLLALVSTGLLILMLSGFVLFALGVQPAFERLFLGLLWPYLRSATTFTRRNLVRYRRRNTTTSIIFALSVALVMFLAGMATTFSALATTMVDYRVGADVRLEAKTSDPDALLQAVRELPGAGAISRLSLSRAYGEELADLRQDVSASDLIGLRRVWVTLFGTDGQLEAALGAGRIEFAEGDVRRAFSAIEHSDPDAEVGAAILSEAVAGALDLKVGAQLRLFTRIGSRSQTRVFEIAGIARRIPGLNRFRILKAWANGSGILVSQAEFDRLLFADAERYGEATIDTWSSLLFVKHAPQTTGATGATASKSAGGKALARAVRERFAGQVDTRVHVISRDEGLEQADSLRQAAEMLGSVALVFTGVIAFFALLASMYATVLERRREIAVFKALGIRRRVLFRVFAAEAMALLLASGTIGAAVGYVLAYLLYSVQTLVSQVPTPFAVPWLPAIGLVVLCVLMGFVCAWLPLRKTIRQPVATILGRTA